MNDMKASPLQLDNTSDEKDWKAGLAASAWAQEAAKLIVSSRIFENKVRASRIRKLTFWVPIFAS